MSIETIGKQIASMRKQRGVKQEELANYVGVSTQAVSKWENGGVPDTDLLPKIADFFSCSIDRLFERNFADYQDMPSALMEKVYETAPEERMKQVFNYCWDMEQSLMDNLRFCDRGSIEDYEKEYKSNQVYSSIMTDYGFTRMGIADRLQYFLIVPEPKDTEAAFFNGIDYATFFKDFSDRDVLNACILLYKRDHKKAFTPRLLVNKMQISLEKANEIVQILLKYRLLYAKQLEMDDEVQIVYDFWPTPSFVALLIFAREIIDPPNVFIYHSQSRNIPYFK